ncbi:ATP-binding protein [Streptomyces sp. NPDC001700]
MKQGTLKTLGVMALGAAALVAGGGVASAAAPGPHGPSAGLGGGQGVGVSAPQASLPGQAAPGKNTGRPAANRPSQPDAQGLLGSLGGLGGLKNSLPTNGIMRLG